VVVAGSCDDEVIVVDAITALEEVGGDVVAGCVPPFRHEHALEIFAGTSDHRAASGCTVWVGARVYAEQKGFATTSKSSNNSRQES
jgi:hypothetical protein